MPNAESDVFSLLVSKTVQSIRRQTRGAPVDSLQQMKHVPIIELVNEVIEEAVRCNASDVHVEPDGDIVRLRFRVDGMLCERHAPLPQEVHAFFVSRLKIMGGMDIAEHRLPQDGRILYVYDGVELDIRISTLPLLTGEKVVLRLLNDKRRLLQFSELDFSERNAAVFQRLCKMPSGLLLVTGQVNSGKTTTLYAALQLLDAARCNIVTLEDPVEYQLHGINQLQVNTKIHLDFAAGLRAVLRQDPDAIMLGEIRDEETAEMAVRAALTGHLLFSTLHTGNAVGAVSRLLEMGIAPYLFSASVLGIVAQRLVRRLCPHCRELYVPASDSREAAFLGSYYNENLSLYRSRGCSACHHSGYMGRVALQELLVMDENMRLAILAGSTEAKLQSLAEAGGMADLREDGIQKALTGITSLAEVGRALYGEL